MWVYEEMVNGEKLTEIINKRHENVKYLPGVALPDNVVAEPDLIKSVVDADLLVFVVPHQVRWSTLLNIEIIVLCFCVKMLKPFNFCLDESNSE